MLALRFLVVMTYQYMAGTHEICLASRLLRLFETRRLLEVLRYAIYYTLRA